LRPPRADIAAPELPAEIEWIGDRPPRMPLLTARGPVLVHFFDFAQLNSVRALPYVRAWHERYGEAGLTVLGVHSPRFPFGADPEVLGGAVDRLEITHPVANDAAHSLWHAYGCEGWPSLFLWSKGGALAWFHFGEGEYQATEEAIQEELRSTGHEGTFPRPMEPLRPTDAPGALVTAPSEEIFPGGSLETPWVGEKGAEIEVEYAAGGAYMTADGKGLVKVALDGEAAPQVSVWGPGLYELVEHPRHGEHSMLLRPATGVRIWSFSFAPGLPNPID
jgi:hypothetical protein